MVFDHFFKPSFKDCEKDSRSGITDRTESFVIVGLSQKRPNDFGAALRNDNFKNSFLKYLVSCWDNQQLQNIMESKVIYVTDDMQCHQIRVIDGKLIEAEQYHMFCSHKEADTRMIFHTKCINGGKVVVIRNNDTDVLICFLANFHLLDPSLKVWLEVGVEGSNSLRYIDLNKLHSKLGWKFCMALAAFHAF